MSDGDQEYVEGVDLSPIDRIAGDDSFPISADELVERHGEVELERTNAEPITLRELFDYMGDDTFESEDQLRTMVLSQMPRDSVGRAGYSDRGGSPEATDESEDVDEVHEGEEGTATDEDTKQQERD